MKNKNFLLIFLAFNLSVGLYSCSSNEKEPRDPDHLVPSDIDDSVIKEINNYDDYQKYSAGSHSSVSFYCDQKLTETDESYIKGFKAKIGNLGELTFFGDSFENTQFQNELAIGNMGRFLAFSYLENVQKTYLFNDKESHIVDSQKKKIDNYSTGTEAHSGSLVLLKSSDSKTWNAETYITDINRKTVLFTPESDDVYKGTYYRLLNLVEFSYIAGYENVSSGFLWWKKVEEKPIYIYFQLIQSFDFFLCSSSSDLRFECGSLSTYSSENSSLTKEEIELVQKSISMTNNSVSTSYINVSLLNPYAKYSYFYEGKDGSDSGELNEPHKFTKPGKYRFVSTNKLGKTKETTLFLINLEDDKGFTQFFGEGICDDSKRIFDSSKPLPVYMIGKECKLPKISSYLPGRYGSIYYFEDDAALISRSSQSLKTYFDFREQDSLLLDKPGYYFFNFTNCDPSTSSGDVLQYTFSMYVSNNVYYSPSVNYNLLRDYHRTNLLATKVFGVSLPTAGGGSYQFIFPYAKNYLQKAYELAVEIEELSVEIVSNNKEKFYFYKSIDNPYVKTNYVNKTTLYEAINKYADLNVSVVYLENDIEYGTSIVEDESLSNLAGSSIRKTLRVVTDESVLQSLRTSELYLNGFKFTQVADYEVDNVVAMKENGDTLTIPFNTSAEDLFKDNGKFKITEKNWNGLKTYDAIFCRHNTSEIIAECNGSSKKFDISNKGLDFTFSTFRFTSVNDELDSQTLIAINDGKTRSVFSMKEIEGLALPKGKFFITAINRNHQTYQFTVTCIDGSSETTTTSYNHDPLRAYLVKTTTGNVENLISENNKIDSKFLMLIALCTSIVLSSTITFFVTRAVERKKGRRQ